MLNRDSCLFSFTRFPRKQDEANGFDPNHLKQTQCRAHPPPHPPDRFRRGARSIASSTAKVSVSMASAPPKKRTRNPAGANVRLDIFSLTRWSIGCSMVIKVWSIASQAQSDLNSASHLTPPRRWWGCSRQRLRQGQTRPFCHRGIVGQSSLLYAFSCKVPMLTTHTKRLLQTLSPTADAAVVFPRRVPLWRIAIVQPSDDDQPISAGIMPQQQRVPAPWESTWSNALRDHPVHQFEHLCRARVKIETHRNWHGCFRYVESSFEKCQYMMRRCSFRAHAHPTAKVLVEQFAFAMACAAGWRIGLFFLSIFWTYIPSTLVIIFIQETGLAGPRRLGPQTRLRAWVLVD